MRRQLGFTVIEVTIFLAISGLLAVIAFAGTSQLISRTRFTDGMNSLDSYMKRQYEEVASGVNVRSGNERCDPASSSSDVVTGAGVTSAPGTSRCVTLGKVIFFSSNAGTSNIVESRYVVGSGVLDIAQSMSVFSALQFLSPTVVQDIGAESYEIPWDMRFSAGALASTNASVNAIALLKSPSSSQINTFIYSGSPSSPAVYTTSNVLTAANFNQTANFCIDDDSIPVKRGAIRLTNGQGSASINAIFGSTGALGC